MTLMKTVMMKKEGHTYIFRFPAHEEWVVFRMFAKWANNPRLSFNWYDAAVTSWKMGQNCDEEVIYV